MTNNTPPTITIDSWGNTSQVHPRIVKYSNDRICIELWVEEDGFMEPFGKVTTNLPDQHLNEGEFFVKDWSENEPMIAALIAAGWLLPTGREVISGFIAPQVMTAGGALLDFINNQG